MWLRRARWASRGQTPPGKTVLSEPAPPPPSKTRARRWVPVGEIVGVVAVLIAALCFWDNHQQRAREDRERAAAERRAAVLPAFVLRGDALPGGEALRLEPVRSDQVIQSQTFIFPAAVRGGAVHAMGEARIEAGWIAEGARKAARGTKPPADGGDLSLPVGIATTYLADGQTETDQSVYRLGYRLKPHLLPFGAKVELVGLSLAQRGVTGDLKARVEVMAR